MRPPRGVYLAALPSTLPMACVRRSASPFTVSGASGLTTDNAWPRSSISGWMVSTARAMSVATSIGSLRQVDLAAGDTRHVQQVVHQTCQMRSCRSIISREPRSCSSEWLMRMRCTALRIGASGLRSSCASIARNSSLLRSASRSACSALVRSMTSLCSARLARASSSLASSSVAFNSCSWRFLSACSVMLAWARRSLLCASVAIQLAQLTALAISSTSTATLLRRISGTTGMDT